MYRNNLVRTALSVFAACTLLFASASAQSSTQLNSPALTPEFSDAPVVTSLGPLLSEDITGDESYTLEVIAMTQGTPDNEAPTMTLAQAELPQLGTPVIRSVSLLADAIILSWVNEQIATTIKLNLYPGDSTSGEALQNIDHLSGLFNLYIFERLTPATQYTVELIAQADGFSESAPVTRTVMTTKLLLRQPTIRQIEITNNSTDNIMVTFRNTPTGVDGYTLFVQKRFDDMGIARTSQDFSIDASPVTLDGLLPGQEYFLGVRPTFNSDLYTYSLRGDALLPFSTRAADQPLDAPIITRVEPFSTGFLLNWENEQIATTIKLNLYPDDSTSGEALQNIDHLNSGLSNVYTFERLTPFTQYTVELIAQAGGFSESAPVTRTVTTTKILLRQPGINQIEITNNSTDNIVVTFRNTPMGVDAYTLFVQKRFDDMGIARTSQDFSIDASPVTLDGLLPGQEYFLGVRPTFNSDLYTYSLRGDALLPFSTRPLPLSNPTMVTAVTEARRESAATVSDIRVAWGSVANAQSYRITLYSGADSSGGTPLGNPISVSTPATTTAFENQLNNQFFTVGVTAGPVSNVYSTSEESFVPVLPPKLSSEFFTVTPSTTSLSLAWDSSYDARLQDGVYFYDATHIGNLGSSASSLLLINIEDLNENRITGPTQVSTEEDAYNTDELSEGTDYVLSIVQRVAIGSDSRDSEALEIPFNTLRELPEPVDEQISWMADGTTLTVSWDNVATNVTNYEISLIREGVVVGTPKEVNALMAGSTTFISLDAGTDYTLSVVAKGVANLYAPSPQYSIAVATLERMSVPVVTLSIASNSSVDIVVSWDSVTNAESYKVSLYSSAGARVSGPIPIMGETQYTFDGLLLGLKFGTEYTVGVIAQGQGLADSLEERQEIMTKRFILTTPRNGDITLTAGQKMVTVQWNDAPTEVTAYLLSIRPDTRSVGEQTIEASGAYTFENLLPDRVYTVSVISSRDETGFDKSGVYMEATQTPSLPQLAKAKLGNPIPSEESIVLNWVGVASVQRYEVNSYLGEGTSGEVATSAVITQTMHTFDGLNFGSLYTLEVIALGIAENHRASDPSTVSAMTTRRQLLIPGEGEIDIAVTAESITVSWNNPPSEVEEYVINIMPGTNQERRLNVRNLSETTFSNLGANAEYTITVVAQTSDPRYTESPVYRRTITTDVLGTLSAPIFTARTENRRGSILIEWGSVANAQRYIVRLYEGASNRDVSASAITEATVNDPTSMHTFGIEADKHYTVGVRAVADTYSESEERRESVLPRGLLSDSFSLTRSTNTLSVNWSSAEGSDVYNKTAFANLIISIEDGLGEVVVNEEISTRANTYKTNALTAGTDYVLKIAVSVTLEGESVRDEALNIEFKTLAVLPIPSVNELSFTVDQNTITVEWQRVPAGVTSYELSLDGEAIDEKRVVDARTDGSTLFSGLTAGTTYTLTAVSSGDDSVYLPSAAFNRIIPTTRPGQLGSPSVDISIESSVDIIVSWFGIESALSYEVNLYLGSDTTERVQGPIDINGLTHTFTASNYGTEYTVGVKAKTTDLNFAISNETIRTIKTAKFILSSPMGVTQLASTDSVTVSWSTVDDSLMIETYLISIAPANGGSIAKEIAVGDGGYTFAGLSADTTHELSVVSSRDETGFVQSSAYTTRIRTRELTQLDTVTLNMPIIASINTLSLNWGAVMNATTYTVNLYLGENTIANPSQSDVVATGEHTFRNLDSGTLYTLEVIAKAENYNDSEPAVESARTLKRQLLAPDNEGIELTATASIVTVNWKGVEEGSGVSTFVLSINPDDQNIGTLEVLALQDGSREFSNLQAVRNYTISVIAQGDSTRYINSLAYTETITTDYVGELTPPSMVTARTENSRSDIRVTWTSVANAQSYTVRLYEGANNQVLEARPIRVDTVDTGETYTFNGVAMDMHYTVGIRAIADTYSTSVETRVSASPRSLLEGSFNLTRSTNSLSVNWDSAMDTDFTDKTSQAMLFISIESESGGVVVSEPGISTTANTYTTNALSEGMVYVLNIVVRVTAGGASLDSEALSIEFKTLAVLPEPSANELSLSEDQNTIRVSWSSVPVSVTSYELTLTGDDFTAGKVVGVRIDGSTEFRGLIAGTAYTLTAISSGDSSAYLPSTAFEIGTKTDDPNQLGRPVVRLSIASSVRIIVNWDSIESATSYEVNLYEGSVMTKIGDTVTATSPTAHTFESPAAGIKFGTEYEVRVKALSSDPNYSDSADGTDKITTHRFILETPRSEDITLTENFRNIIVRWNRVSERASDYLLRITPQSGMAGEESIPATENQYIFVGLLPDTTYTVSIVATRNETSLVESGEYMETTRTPPLPRLATAVLNNPTATEDSLELTWTTVTDATAYTVNLYLGDSRISAEQTAEVTDPMHTFTNLDFGSAYTLEVIAMGSVENYRDSVPSTTLAMTTRRTLPTPQGITLTVTANSLTVKWSPPLSGVEQYTISIMPGTEGVRTVPVNPTETLFENLKARTEHTIEVIAKTTDTRYEDSPAYSDTIRTDYIGRLTTPEVTAVTESRRERIKVSWGSVDNAQGYTVRLYEGLNNTNALATEAIGQAGRMHTFDANIKADKHYAVGVSAVADTYSTSVETRVSASPRSLLEGSFNLARGSDSLSVSWDSMTDNDFSDKTNQAVLFIRIEDGSGVVVVNEEEISTREGTYKTNALTAGTDYVLKIAVSVTLEGELVRGEALSIEFKTLAVLPTPSLSQLSFTPGLNTITVEWERVPAGVTSYELSLDGEGIDEKRVVDARTDGSTLFSGLTAGTTYTLTAVSSGDDSVYLPSAAFNRIITTTRDGQLDPPSVSLSIESSVEIVVGWNDVPDAMNYEVSLYVGRGVTERVQGPIDINGLTHTFTASNYGTEYTVGVKAKTTSTSFTISNETIRTIKTAKFILSSPMGVTQLASTDSVTVSWPTVDDSLMIETYLISIAPANGDSIVKEIAATEREYTFASLSAATKHKVSVVSSRDETGFVQSSAYTTEIRTKVLTQLDTVIFGAAGGRDSLALNWGAVMNATAYTVSLYLGEDTSVAPLERDTVALTRYTFRNLDFGLSYTAVVIAQAIGYTESDPEMRTARTTPKRLEIPTREQIMLSATSESLTVSWSNPPSAVERYSISIEPDDNGVGAQEIPIGNNSVTFDNLEVRARYEITVRALTSSGRYINSFAYSDAIMTDYISQLSTPELTAVTENRRESIKVSWDSINNAQSYTVRLYEGANNQAREARPIRVEAGHTGDTYTFASVAMDMHHTVGITAIADTYSTSVETRVSASPRSLLEGSFNLTRSTNSLSVSWDSVMDTDFSSKTNQAALFIRIENQAGDVIVNEPGINTTANTYTTEALTAGTDYVLKIAVSVTLEDEAVRGEALSIEFRTLAVLPVPKGVFTWTPSQDTITVNWNNSLMNVANYVLTLGNGVSTVTSVVDAGTEGSTLFGGLTAGTIYTLTAVSSGDDSVYLPSAPFSVDIETDDLNELGRPTITSLSIASSMSIALNWESVTDADNYEVRLYLGDDTTIGIGDPVVTENLTHTFVGLSLATTYTVGVIAQSESLVNSFQTTDKIVSVSFTLPRPNRGDIRLIETHNSVTVEWDNSPAEVDIYLLIIDPDTGNAGQKEVGVSEGGYTFTGLQAGEVYTVSVVSSKDATGYVESSAQSRSVVTLTRPARLRLRLRAFLEGPLQ